MTGGLTKHVDIPGQSLAGMRQPQARPQISIVVPMLNEIDALPELLRHLSRLRPSARRPKDQHPERAYTISHDIILVDGGSTDGTPQAARQAGFRVVDSPKGRARQMNTGASQARGDVLLFLHADTRLPNAGLEQITHALKGPSGWGRFDVRITGSAFMLKIVAQMMNLRSRITGIATGDQAIFVDRVLFESVGGFPDQPLMEDIELSSRLRQVCHPICLKAKVITSGRRWMDNGVWRTIFLMWRLRWAYWRGVSAEQLAKRYR